jgi:hypothetical protein
MSFELVVEVETESPGELIVRCVDGALRVGDVIKSAAEPGSVSGSEVSLEVDSIERYEGVLIDELESSHVGRIRVHGDLPIGLLPGSRLAG